MHWKSGAELVQALRGASLIRNLMLGARLAFGVSVQATSFRPSFEAVALLLVVVVAVASAGSYPTDPGELYFDASGAAVIGTLMLLFLLYVLAVARVRGAVGGTLLATMLAAAAPWYLAVVYAVAVRGGYAMIMTAGWGLLIVVRALGLVFPGSSRRLAAFTVLLAACSAFLPWYRVPPARVIYAYDESEYERYSDIREEDVFYRQPALLESEASRLLPQRPGVPDLYFVGFAGDADSAVFWREATYARSVMDDRFGTAGRSLVLSGNLDELETAPIASSYNLALLLQQVAEHMNLEEDALFLFLTSHGSENAELTVSLHPLDLKNLSAGDLREALDGAGIKWRIIVISACHSGSFIDTLRDNHTVILAAAARDRQSFGCSEDRELTYFGEAFFKDALSERSDLLAAFARAQEIIAARESTEGLTPSEPQISIGQSMRERLEAHEGQPGIW